MRCKIIASSAAALLLMSGESFSETSQEQLYRLAGIKTQEQKAIEKLESASEKQKEDIEELRREIELLRERLNLVEIRTSK